MINEVYHCNQDLIVETEQNNRNTKGQLEEKDQAIVALSDQVMKLSYELDMLKQKIRI